jgi:hypothetical protein
LKQVVNAKLVKLGETGVGVAQLDPNSSRGGQFVYFKPRDLAGYSGETWSELALPGLKPGRSLQIDVDFDSSGLVHQVSGVRVVGR